MPLKTHHLYSLQLNGKLHGKYIGVHPSQVAKKIFRKLSNAFPICEFCVIDRVTNKEFFYVGEKKVLAIPIVKRFGSREIICKHLYRIKRKYV